KDEAVIVDTWWQTETGGFLCSTIPALERMKPGSAGPGLPGIYPVIFDEQGKEMPAGSGRAGNICIRNPWPGIMQTIWGDPARMVKTYYAKYCKNLESKSWSDWPYFAGDGAMLAEDGYFRVLGRVDDVINVAGHRLGTAEVESALVAHPKVSEAAVVGYPHNIKGQGIYAYVTLMAGAQPTEELRKELTGWVRKEISPIASPDLIQFAPNLPKTRSGKIMRRILRKIAEDEFGNLGDTSTLADPAVVDDLVNNRQNKSKESA
ncbi:MAG TPA: AMP-binding protein, partial [Xanthobacteraceae bacterium]|nr:AMP-binding protein [Xanthobacteraceae bacterium]